MANHQHMQINIQFLRFLAALSVVLFHAGPYVVTTGDSAFDTFFNAFSWCGYAGVDVFFVISGYIMWTTTRTVQGLPDVGYFLYKRAARIYLGYWPYCLLMLLMLSLYSVKISRDIDYAGSILLTQTQTHFLLLAVTWSLTYELYFYAVFAGVLLIPQKIRPPALGIAFVVVVATLLLVWFVGEDTLRGHVRWVLKGSRFYLSPFCAEFIGGCLLAIYFEKMRSISPWLCGIVCVSLVAAAVWYQQNDPLGTGSLSNYPHRRVAFFGPAALALVALMVELEHRGQVLFKRVSLLFGGASYSLYLSHVILLRWFHHAGFHTKLNEWPALPDYGKNAVMVLLLVFIIVYSIGHYLFVEKPLMTMARKVIPHKETT
jgi:exopolysaccharide production protein ExoZ